MPGFQHTERETWERGEGLSVYRRSQHSGGLLAPALRNQGPGGRGLVCQDVPRVKTRVQPYEIKDPSVGKDRGQEEKKASEDGMAGWHHRRSGRELGNLWEMVKDREACHAAVHGLQLKESDITEQLNNSNVKLKEAFSLEGNHGKPEKQRLHFADKGPYSQSYGFSSSHIWM